MIGCSRQVATVYSTLFCLLVLLALPARAQYPDKPVRLVVAYSPGGATDVIARLLARQLGVRWNQQVIVENRPGANGMLGAEQVVRAAPDGYTLLVGYTQEVSLNKLVFKSMRYDPITDLTPLALAASAPLVLVTGPKRPLGSLRELAALKGSGENLAYGSPGIGGQQHIAGELLARELGLALTQVQYKGTGPAVQDLLGGQIDILFATIPPLLPHIRAGKLRPIAVASNAREPLLPDVPSMVELGYPRIQLLNWFGVFGPQNLPPALAAKISADVAAAIADPGVTKALLDQGLTPSSMQGAALREFIAAEMEKYRVIIAETGIRAE